MSTLSAPRLRPVSPADPNQWRRFLMVRRHERLRQTRTCWSIADLADDIDNRSMPLGFRSPPFAHWSNEFFAALANGLFGKGRRTRVLLLHPQESARRLTVNYGRHITQTGNLGGYATFAWIRIDDAHDWLATWLDQWFIERWLSDPRTRDALRAVRQLSITAMARAGTPALATSTRRPRESDQPDAATRYGATADAPSSGRADAAVIAAGNREAHPQGAVPVVADAAPAPADSGMVIKAGVRMQSQRRVEAVCEHWLRDLAETGKLLPTRTDNQAAAKTKFGHLLSDKAFERAWLNVAKDYPGMSKPGPRQGHKRQ